MKRRSNEEEDEDLSGPSSGHLIWVREITPPSAELFAARIFKMSSEDPERPILIYIDSPGGYIDSLMSMLSALDFVPNPIITVAMGEAASCASVLLSHGDARFASPYCRIMIHEATGGGVGNVHDAKNQVAELEYANERLIYLLARNCGKTRDAIAQLILQTRRDVYLSPEEAKSLGLIDHIGVPTITPFTAYNVAVHTPPPNSRRARNNVRPPLQKPAKKGKKSK